MMNFFGAFLAFLLGAAIAAVNYGFSRFVLKKHPEKFALTPVLRMVLQVGYLAAVFFLAPYTPWDRLWLLVGACLGVTLPMIGFTYRLVKLNDQVHGKEDPSDG